MTSRKRTRRFTQGGHALIELAFSAAVMMSCLAGTVQFGYTFYAYNQLVSAVGNGGRYAVMRTYRAATPEDVERGRAAIRNMVVFGEPNPAPGATPMLPNLTPAEVQVKWTLDASGAPDAVDVAIAGYAVNAVFGAMKLDGRPAVEFPYVGRYAPSEREP
ncbi:MAG TPA: TadE family protein [Bryobacteraceae bacterium]|nr:TadE family protein [Bryobacteraceae bacterium]